MKNLQILLLFILPFGGMAQKTIDLNCIFQELFLSGNMNKWSLMVDSLQKISLDQVKEVELLYAEYGIIGYLLATNQKDKAEKRVAQFENHVQKMLLLYPTNATYLAFDVSLSGFKMGLTPWKAIVLGPKASLKLDKAFAYRKNEILPIIEQANSLYFRPSIVGGDKQEAKKLYELAFNQLGENGNCNWLYFSIGSWLGQVYTKLNEPLKARVIYTMLLKKAPDFRYVKEQLLPQLENGTLNNSDQRMEKLFR